MIITVSGDKTPNGISYKGIELEEQKKLFNKSFDFGTKHHAEYLAIVHAIGYCVNILKLTTDISIYTDSFTAIKWCKYKKSPEPKGEMKKVLDYADFFLQTNSIPYIVLKWEDNFGLNPARQSDRSFFMVLADIEETINYKIT